MESLSYSKKMIERAVGAFLFILSLLFFLSPFCSLHPLGYGVLWLFGFTGYYFLLPFLAFLGGFLLFKGRMPRFGWKASLGIALIFVGVGFLFGTLSYRALGEDLSAIFGAYGDIYSKSEIVYDVRFAGGVPLTCLLGLMAKATIALPIALIVLFLLSGSFLVLLAPVLLPFFHKISLSSARKKSLKKSKKALEAAPIDNPPFAYEADPFLKADGTAFRPMEEEPERKPLPSRSSRLVEARFSSSSLPEEIDSPYRNWEPTPEEKAVSGLVEARFKGVSSPKAVPFGPLEPKKAESKELEPSEKETSSLGASSVSNVLKIESEPVETQLEKEEVASFEAERVPESAANFSNASFNSIEESFPPNAEEGVGASSPLDNSTILSKEETAEAEAAEEKEPFEEEKIVSESEAPLPKEDAGLSAPQEQNVLPVSESVPHPEIEREQDSLISSVQSGSESDHWTAPPAKPTKEQLLDHLGMPHKSPLKPYTLPPLDLLKDYPPSPEAEQEKLNCETRKNTLDDVFRSFNIKAHVEDYTIGPSVTRYNIRLEPGYAVSNITRHVTDIAISLQGIGVRFEELVRGRSTSGLEVPNDRTTTVSLKRMVESLPDGKGSGLVIPFGVNIDNKPIFSDLSAFPHLLTAGTTGSGKSVFLTGIIMSLIMRNRPEDLKLVLVDPKRVEMALYHDLPHLLCPIIKEPSEAKVCLDKLIDEMERRYRAFEIAGVKDIREWNSEFVESSDYGKMPYIVVFIDEYADLSDNCKNVGDSVVRLAQKARAAGIHLVIATQRPSVSVITGTIKANIPVRVALSMSSAIDSQTIIGQAGAEDLVGHGDMLVDCSLITRIGLTRCQGCYCDNHEINSVCDYIRNQMDPEFDSNFMDLVDHEAERKAQEALAPTISKAEMKAQSYETMYEKVKEVVMTMEYTSISKIQRQFGVGFPRAGKLFAQLQNEGIVAAAPETASSSKGCKVLVHGAPMEGESIKLAGDNE